MCGGHCLGRHGGPTLGVQPMRAWGESGQTDLLDNCLKPRTEHVVLKAMVRIGRNSVILCSVRDLVAHMGSVYSWGVVFEGF